MWAVCGTVQSKCGSSVLCLIASVQHAQLESVGLCVGALTIGLCVGAAAEGCTFGSAPVKWPPTAADADEGDEGVTNAYLLLKHWLKHKHRSSASSLADEVLLTKEATPDCQWSQRLPRTRKKLRT